MLPSHFIAYMFLEARSPLPSREASTEPVRGSKSEGCSRVRVAFARSRRLILLYPLISLRGWSCRLSCLSCAYPWKASSQFGIFSLLQSLLVGKGPCSCRDQPLPFPGTGKLWRSKAPTSKLRNAVYGMLPRSLVGYQHNPRGVYLGSIW